jgi:hypothetical protein
MKKEERRDIVSEELNQFNLPLETKVVFEKINNKHPKNPISFSTFLNIISQAKWYSHNTNYNEKIIKIDTHLKEENEGLYNGGDYVEILFKVVNDPSFEQSFQKETYIIETFRYNWRDGKYVWEIAERRRVAEPNELMLSKYTAYMFLE